MKSILYLFMILLFSCSARKDFEKGEFEDYSFNKFNREKGIVYQTDTYFSWKHLEKSRDIYYMYNLDSDTLYDIVENSTLFGIHEGDAIEIMVHEDDKRINFYNGRW
ncbi:MAG: hypothetical protein AAFQ94_09115 [Bacteroidota bacterium]